MINLKSISFIIILVIFQNYIYSAQNSSDKKLTHGSSELERWIDNQFESKLKDYNIPGGSLVIVRGGEIIHSKGYGIGDFESGRSIDSESSLIHIASISKTFLAVVIMSLVEDGRLELDDDINKYLKSFNIDPLEGQPITIKDLLHHTAGFSERNIGTTSFVKNSNYSLSKYLEEMLPKQKEPAGKIYSYSNFGYALLALIVEEVSGRSYEDLLREEILSPLEMGTTSFDMRDDWSERYVKSYDIEDGNISPIHTGFDLKYPSGGIITSTREMGNFIEMILNSGKFKDKQVVDSVSIKRIFETEFTYIEGSSSAQLFGLMKQKDYNGSTVYYKSGGLFGFSSLLFLIPEQDFGVFIFVNAPDIMKGVGSAFNFSFINSTLWDRFKLGFSVKSERVSVPKEVIPNRSLDSYVGTYRYCVRYSPDSLEKLAVFVGMFPDIEVRLEDGRLINSFGETLIPIGEDTFYESGSGYKLKFGVDGEEISHILYEGVNGYVKIDWYESLKVQKIWSVGMISLVILYLIYSLFKNLFIRGREVLKIEKIAITISLLILLFIAILVGSLTLVPFQEYSYGVPIPLKFGLVIPFLIIILEIWGVITFIRDLMSGSMRISTIIVQSTIIITYLSFIPWLIIWNLLGYNY